MLIKKQQQIYKVEVIAHLTLWVRGGKQN